MSDESSIDKKTKKAATNSNLPPQSSPLDTSNWDDRALSTPSVRNVINMSSEPKRLKLRQGVYVTVDIGFDAKNNHVATIPRNLSGKDKAALIELLKAKGYKYRTARKIQNTTKHVIFSPDHEK